MQRSNFFKAGILTLVLVITALGSWEFYLRHKGIAVDYDDDEALWSNQRPRVYEPQDKVTVFIGSSRIKYALDIPTWESITGNHAIQLANVGSDPRPVLDDLANDPKFKGNLVVDVMEALFFSEFAPNDELTAKKIAYFKTRTPAERCNFQLDHALESRFVFLDKFNFSANALLDELEIPNRPGVFAMPLFPRDFERVRFDRQSYMTERFLAEPRLQNRVKGIWGFLMKVFPPPITGPRLDAILNSVKISVDKIKARGGHVLFVRTPCSGPDVRRRKQGLSTCRLLHSFAGVATECQVGIYFSDYPALAHFRVSRNFHHLRPSDAVIFTKELARDQVEKDKGWRFAR